MDEIWERAVETALDGQTDVVSVRTLTLDGAVKCVQGRLPPPSLFEKFENLQHLSIANIGVSSLEQFPRLRNLQKLILSDNRISGGLEFLVQSGLHSLRDLDLSNNRIQDINDLSPLAQLRLVSLDLYECPVTRVRDYRSRVFGLIKSLKYLDKMDAEENERPESDDEDEEEDEEVEEEDDEDDPGSGEIDGEDHWPYRMSNGHRSGGNEEVVDVDEDEGSDADEEETETSRGVNGSSRVVLHSQSNGFCVEGLVDGEDGDDDEEEGGGQEDGDNDSAEEIDDEEGEEDDVVEVHEIGDSDDEEDGVEEEDDDDDDEDDEDDDDDVDDDEEEEVDNDEGVLREPKSTGRLMSTEGEIDGHEHGEDDADEDDNGETGEEELGVEEAGGFNVEDVGEDEEEDYDTGYLVQPVVGGQAGQGQVEVDAGGSDMDAGNEEEEEEEEDDDDDDDDDDDEDPDLEDEDDDDDEDGEVQELPQPPSHKRKRDEQDSEDEEDNDVVECTKSSKTL